MPAKQQPPPVPPKPKGCASRPPLRTAQTHPKVRRVSNPSSATAAEPSRPPTPTARPPARPEKKIGRPLSTQDFFAKGLPLVSTLPMVPKLPRGPPPQKVASAPIKPGTSAADARRGTDAWAAWKTPTNRPAVEEPQTPPGTPPARRASEPAPPSALAAGNGDGQHLEAPQSAHCSVGLEEAPLPPASDSDIAAAAEVETQDVVSTDTESDEQWEAPAESPVPPGMQPRLEVVSPRGSIFAPLPMSSRRGSVAPPGSFSPRAERVPLKRHSSVGAPRGITREELAARLVAGMAKNTLADGTVKSRRPRRPSVLLEALAEASPTLASVIAAVKAASMGITVNPLPADGGVIAMSAGSITAQPADIPHSYVASRGTSEATKLGDEILSAQALRPAVAARGSDNVFDAIVKLCREAHRAAQEDFEVEGIKTYQPLWTVPASLPDPNAAPERISPEALDAHAVGARDTGAASAALDALVRDIDADRIAVRHALGAADSVAIVEGAELIASTVRAATRSREPITVDRITKRLDTVLRAGSAEDLAREAVSERNLADGLAADSALQTRIVELRDAIVASSSSYENVGQLASMEEELDALMVRRFDTFDAKVSASRLPLLHFMRIVLTS